MVMLYPQFVPFTSDESFAFVERALRALALDRPTGPGVVHLVCTRLHIVSLIGGACLQFTYIRGRPTVHKLICTSTGCARIEFRLLAQQMRVFQEFDVK